MTPCHRGTPGGEIAVARGRGGDIPRWWRGFTLVEMLVVVAVVGALASLLWPALAGARGRAKRSACLNNLRQLVLADTLYLGDAGRFPEPHDFVPSSMTADRLGQMGRALGMPVPSGPVGLWPKRRAQPAWYNCPMAIESGYAEGVTLGGGVYTGYSYVGGLETSRMVTAGLATLVRPEHLADARNSRRGVLWADVLDEFLTPDTRRFEFFHSRGRVRYPDFRFSATDLDGIHRGWSDGSVEWVSGKRLRLDGNASPDLQIRHFLGNYYF